MVSKIFDKLKKKLKPVLKDTSNHFLKEIRLFQHENPFGLLSVLKMKTITDIVMSHLLRLTNSVKIFLNYFGTSEHMCFASCRKEPKNFPLRG